ncbi:hypothetical protein M0R45_024583 [Rubus argutus]|uniref:Phytocyanin domain-containing protein n=1 Tax=Rubus argutus TaxID=59490 RepID=A0AAW1WRH5_RUBAR
MASSQLFITLAILAIFAPSILATNYVVGEYKAGLLTSITKPGLGERCSLLATTLFSITRGKDVINLATPGRKWYICGVSNHCAVEGQKLVITVMPSLSAPSPSPTAGC